MCNGLNHKQKDCKNSNKSANFRVTTSFICCGRHRTDQRYKNKTWKKDGGMAAFVRQVPRESKGNDFIVPVFINGVRCSALRDSGCNLVLVRESVLIDKTCYTRETITVNDVFGRT